MHRLITHSPLDDVDDEIDDGVVDDGELRLALAICSSQHVPFGLYATVV